MIRVSCGDCRRRWTGCCGGWFHGTIWYDETKVFGYLRVGECLHGFFMAG